MAKVSSTGLPWLSKPSVGYDLFSKPSGSNEMNTYDGGVAPNRQVAIRDTEIFVGRGNEVRCADLQDLKARHPKKAPGIRGYKVLDLPDIDFEITQLEISHDRLYLAIIGETELAICVLPGEGFLKRGESKVTVPHFHKVGQGVHNPSDGGRIVRVLWHPLGVEGASLVVLTADSFVRTYDFTIGSDVSFEVPDETFDLFTLSGHKRHVGGFAADYDEMEPASCCFGAGEEGWRPFTLYIIMRGGDIYALSPIVPSRWMASRNYLQSLSVNITAELECLDENASWERRATIRQQTKWINDVLNQEAGLANAYSTISLSPRQHNVTCLTRPSVVGSNPLLQGPFLFQPEPPEAITEDCYAACDIFHVDAVSASVIGIVYSNGRVDICLEFDPVGAMWMDKKKPLRKVEEQKDLPVISSYETIDLCLQAGPDSEFTNWPVFTKEPQSDKLWFVTHNSGVTSFSMKAWLDKLDTILDDEEDNVIGRMLENSRPSEVQQVIQTDNQPIVGCAAVYEAYIGYMLVAASATSVFSAEFDEPVAAAVPYEEDTITLQPNIRALRESTPRARTQSPAAAPVAIEVTTPEPNLPVESVRSPLYPPYVVAPEFTQPSALKELLQQEKRRNPKLVSSSFVFSTETSAVFRKARDTLKTEFDQLMEAAQEMYDRANGQRVEYEKQLDTLRSVSQKLDGLRDKKVKDRLDKFIERQERLQSKADELLKTLIIKSETGLSDAEKRWFREVWKMQERLQGDTRSAFAARLEELKHMTNMLCPDDGEDEFITSSPSVNDGIPEEVRKGKLNQLRQLLDKEDTLVKSTKKRLENLSLEAERVASAKDQL